MLTCGLRQNSCQPAASADQWLLSVVYCLSYVNDNVGMSDAIAMSSDRHDGRIFIKRYNYNVSMLEFRNHPLSDRHGTSESYIAPALIQPVLSTGFVTMFVARRLIFCIDIFSNPKEKCSYYYFLH